MLFAEFFEPFSGGTLLVLAIIFTVATRKISTVLKDNDTLRGAAKKGAISVLGRIFR